MYPDPVIDKAGGVGGLGELGELEGMMLIDPATMPRPVGIDPPGVGLFMTKSRSNVLRLPNVFIIDTLKT